MGPFKMIFIVHSIFYFLAQFIFIKYQCQTHEMAKIKCDCGQYHRDAKARAKCLKQRGKLGNKNKQKMEEEIIQEGAPSQRQELLAKKRQLIQQEFPQKISNIAQKINKSTQKLQIINHFIQTRRGFKSFNSLEIGILKNRNFHREMNKKQKPEPNVLQEIAKETLYYQNKEYYQNAKNSYGKKTLFKKLDLLKQRENQLFKVIQEIYIQDSLSFQLKFGKWLPKEIFQMEKNITKKCKKQIQIYRDNFEKIGKVHKFNARYQPFQQILSKQCFQLIEFKQQKVGKIMKLIEFDSVQKQSFWRRQQLFNLFRQQAFKNQIEPLLFLYKKQILTNQNGEFVSFRKVKLAPIRKSDSQEIVNHFNRQIMNRFELICQICRTNAKNTKQIQFQILYYPKIYLKIDRFYRDQREKKRIKTIIQHQYQSSQEYICFKNQQLNKSNQQNQIKFKDNYIYVEVKQTLLFNATNIIENQFDFSRFLLSLMQKKNIKITRQKQRSSINYMLTQVQPCFITLAPQGFKQIKRKDIEDKRVFVYFRQSDQTKQILQKYLYSKWICYQRNIRGYSLQLKRDLFRYKHLTKNSSPSVCDTTQWSPQEKQSLNLDKSMNCEQYIQRQICIERQEQFLTKYQNHLEIMSRVDGTLEICYWRKKHFLHLNRLFYHNKGNINEIRNFILAFPNFYKFNRQGYIQWRKKELQILKQGILNQKYKIQTVQSKNQKIIVQNSQQQKFNEIQLEIPFKCVKLFIELQQNRNIQKLPKSLLTKIESKKYNQVLNLLKECSVCKNTFNLKDYKRKLCKICYNQMHLDCAEKINKCFCQDLELHIQKISQFQLNMNYSKLVIIKKSNLKRNRYQGIKTFLPKTQKNQIQAKEKQIISALYARNKLLYSHNALIHNNFVQNVQIDRYYDPFLADSEKNLEKQWKKYSQGHYKAPVKLKITNQSFFGIQTLQEIPKLTLICQYAADIIPSAYTSKFQWKDHIMLYSQGKNCLEELVLVPFNFSNWGPLINHSETPNCSYLRIVIQDTIRVLIYSVTNIPAKNQLLINYNGFHNQYPIENFQNLSISK